LPVEKTASVIDVRAMASLLSRSFTQDGESLAQMASSPALLVFLRHAGCTFCREALADIALSRSHIEGLGVRIVLVHMGDTAELEPLLAIHKMLDIDRICDANQELYKAFGLKQGSFTQLFGPKVWWRGFRAGLLAGHGLGKPVADSSQMPGVFLLERGIIARRFRHRSAADRPDYVGFCSKT
jgi:peroxiredoxin